MDSGDGYIFVFDITDDATFDEVTAIRNQLKEAHPQSEKVPILLVGNKNDLEDKRVVTQEEAKTLSEDFNCDYTETSAKGNHNVDGAFRSIVRTILEKQVGKAWPHGVATWLHERMECTESAISPAMPTLDSFLYLQPTNRVQPGSKPVIERQRQR